MTEFSPEYQSLVEEFNNSERARYKAVQECINSTAKSVHFWDQLNELRRSMLRQILVQNDLEICDAWHQPEPNSELKAEMLGILPSTQIMLIYETRVPQIPDGIIGQEYRQIMGDVLQFDRTETLKFRCPAHPINPVDREWSVSVEDGKPNFRSQVVKENNRFITKLLSLDITSFVQDSINRREYDEEDIYRLLNLPKLPDQPKDAHLLKND